MAGLQRKYVVFKAEDYDKWVSELPAKFKDDADCALPEPLVDAVVLRKQDVFTSSALYEYAGQIRTTVEIIEKMMTRYESPKHFLQGLKELADSFTEEAEDAELTKERKLPD